MDGGLVARGFLLGFAVAAPVGPIGVLVIRRTLALGPRAGFVSGLGAATADAGYGCVAVLGLAAATRLLVANADWLRGGGGLFLCWSGSAPCWPGRLRRERRAVPRGGFGRLTGPRCSSRSPTQ